MDIKNLIESINNNMIRISDHADEEAQEDGLGYSDIFHSVRNGEIIEDYPNDKPFPSCLVFGLAEKRQHIHSVWAYNSDNRWAVLITVYIPDPERWIDWKIRKDKHGTI